MRSFFWGFAVGALFLSPSVLLAAKDDVTLTCKNKKNATVPDWVPGLKKYLDKKVTVVLNRKELTIKADGIKDAQGKAYGELPTDLYMVGDLGTEGRLALASAGALVGAKTTQVYLYAKGNDPDEKNPKEKLKQKQLSLSCTNDFEGQTARFIKLCVDEPQIKETQCTARNDEDNLYGMPKKLTLKSIRDGLQVDYIDGEDFDDAKPVSEVFAFVANEDVKPNATVKLVENCYYAAPSKSRQPLQLLRLTRALSETSEGRASTTETASDGAATILYDCKK